VTQKSRSRTGPGPAEMVEEASEDDFGRPFMCHPRRVQRDGSRENAIVWHLAMSNDPAPDDNVPIRVSALFILSPKIKTRV
jgi:hypothetical protein